VTRSWVARVVIARLSSSWRLLGVVTLVAVLAAATVSTLGLLAAATEQAGTRSALTALPSTESNLVVDELQLHGSVAANRKQATAAIGRVLGPSVSARVSTEAFAIPGDAYIGGIVPSATYYGRPVPAATYLGEIEGVRSQTVLVSGSWPTLSAANTTTEIPVAIPQAGAIAAHLDVGARFRVQVDSHGGTRSVVVVGVYRAKNPHSAFWKQDPLHGAGNVSPYPLPSGLALRGTDGFGPTLVAPGELDAASVRVDSAHFVYPPDFRRMTVDAIAPLIDRLGTAANDLSTRVGYSTEPVEFNSNLGTPLTAIASSLLVTRSTVVIVALLLLLLAVGALSQTARLFNDAQAGERALMAARGASRAQILALSIVQAVTAGILIAAIAPLLARAAFAGLAAQPAMIRAGMPRDSGLPAIDWLGAGVVAVLFVVVLVLPQLARGDTFVGREQGKGRQRRGAGLMRSGLDLGLVVLAGILYWQLLIYRSPVGAGAALTIDPVLVAAPVIVLLAGALVSVRLIPVVARLTDRIASGGKGVVLPLAAWEVARRSRQAISAVLLLTLALGVGAFGQTFLATWQQSQVDQANLAVGPPLRVPASLTTTARQAVALGKGAAGSPQPIIDRVATVENGSGSDTGQNAVVLGLGKQARAMLETGRLAQEGGDQINKIPGSATQSTSSFSLPADATAVTATVRIGTPRATVPGVSANISALLEEGDGLLSTFALGSVSIDGLSHGVDGALPPAVSGASGLRIVGLEINLMVSDQAAYGAGNAEAEVDTLVGGLAAVSQPKGSTVSAADSSTPLSVGASNKWSGASIGGTSSPVTTGHVPVGWQLRMGIVVPALVGAEAAEFILTGWTPDPTLLGLITTGMAKATGAQAGDVLSFDVSGTQVLITVAGIVPLVPATAQLSQLSPSGITGAGIGTAAAIVVDQTALERALIRDGDWGPLIDEWWVDVPSGHAAAYLAAHPESAAGGRSRELLAEALEEGPLRIATQAALWLAIVAAAILASIGFTVHTAATMRARRLEFAQLRAIGLSRRALAAVIGAESALLGVIGTIFGVGIGVLLSWLVGPLVALSPDGSPAVPGVVLNVPGANIALLVLAVIVVLACVVVAVATAQRSIQPAQILREADD
jgi:FtsX-like permease family